MPNGESHAAELLRPPALVASAAVLTPREWEAMSLLKLGLRDKEIAERMQIGTCTVNAFLKRIFPKLEAHTRRQAVQKVFGAWP
jgi:DNA-binding NarL/FixJ family response regulator